jgi:membrane protease YdiL (CAAX protease family)
VDSDPGIQPPAFTPPPLVEVENRPTRAERATALLEVIICSGFPTQIAVASMLLAFGIELPADASQLRLGYVVTLELLDTALLTALIVVFLRAEGEQPADLFFGGRPIGREILTGVPLIFMALVVAIAVLGAIQQFAPWLHTVPRNPLQDLIRTPRDAAVFAVMVVVAGGCREEIQRAFLLRRFEQYLGGPAVGVVVASVAFGAGHQMQGADAAITVGVLGAFWCVVYLRRRSIVAPVVSHAGFNLLQLGQLLVIGGS